MIELLFSLSLLVNAGLLGRLYFVRKQSSAPRIVNEAGCKATELVQEATHVSSSTVDIAFFKTEKDKLFFLLNEVDGKRRNQLLGITSDMYSDERLSKQWFKRMSNKVHPDKNPHDPRATLAFDNLKKLYSLMTL